MNESKISIIVPIYNVEMYLEKCLKSLVKQTYSNIEIICVNDGSTDNSKIILESYKNKDSRIISINQSNQGLSAARNKGIKIATGEYIMFVDSDDWIDLDTCELTVQTIEKYDADIVLWPYIREYESKSIKKIIFEEKLIIFEKDSDGNKLYKRLIGPTKNELSKPENVDSLVTACMKLYKTNLIKSYKIEFIDTEIIGTEDALFNIYYFSHVEKAVYLNEFLYHYWRDNTQSLTTKYKENLNAQWNSLFNMIEEHIHSNNLDKDFSTALNNRIALSIIGLGLNELNSKKNNVEKIKEINKIMSNSRYDKAIKELDLSFFPLHWKFFFIVVKKKIAFLTYTLLNIIEKMR